MSELKPCPFCGGTAKFIKIFKTKRYNGFVRCARCGHESRVYTSKQNAVIAWNKGTKE